MALTPFSFIKSLTDALAFPKPGNRAMLQKLHDETLAYINGTLKTFVDSTDTRVTTIENRSYVRAYQSIAQTINATTVTKVLFQTESYDSQTEFDSSRFTAKVAGIISVNAAVFWDTTQLDTNATILYVYKNGSKYSEIDVRRTGAAGFSQSSGSCNVKVAIGDYIEIYAYTSQQLATLVDDTWVDFCRIA